MKLHEAIIKKTFTTLVFSMTAFALIGQIGLGEWRTHLPYYFSYEVVVGDEKTYCSTTGGLFCYDMSDNSHYPLSKTDGLSDNEVEVMNWSEKDQLLVLVYKNSNIDIIKGNQIINIPDLHRKQIPGDKSVNDIYFLDNLAYLSCGFGIVILDLEKNEITETYYIGDEGSRLPVNMVTSDDIYIYAATNEGVRRADKNNPFLVDYHSWQVMENIPNAHESFSCISSYNDRLFVVYDGPTGQNDQLYYFDNGWYKYNYINDTVCYELRNTGKLLLFTGNNGVSVINKNFIVISKYQEGSPRSAGFANSTLWVADWGRGLIKNDDTETIIRPNGPYVAYSQDMQAAGGKLYSVAGGFSSSYINRYRSGSLYTFEDQKWYSNINYNIRDLISVAVDPTDPDHVFAASWGYGLAEFRDRQLVEVYNEFNSSLQNAVPGGDFIRIGGVTYDNDGNLWMTNSWIQNPVAVFKKDGTWKSFRVGGLLSEYEVLGDVLVTQSDHLWAIIPRRKGLFAANFNGTIDDENDDEYKLVNVVDENGELLTNDITAFVEDMNGNLWLGTNEGILVMYNPSQLFTEGSIYAQEIIVPRNDGTNYGDVLLKTQRITCIEVDGANRKWIGTENGGAFLVSSTGLEKIYEFNTSNSPLLSNNILDICVEGESGEVFFGTEKGLISFRGESTQGADNYNEVQVFPNPVREDYDGPIAIRGLMPETTVKITDIAGNLVNEIESFGGQALWDGTNFNGDKVKTGVYLIFLAKRGTVNFYAHVTKVLVVR